jgi:hypothetical protein
MTTIHETRWKMLARSRIGVARTITVTYRQRCLVGQGDERGAVTAPEQMQTYSTPEEIADIVYEAATDGRDRLRYVAGPDARAAYALRRELGDEAFHTAIARQYFG